MEEDLSFELGKKLQNKELEIDGLNARLRKSEFEHQKLVSELEAERSNTRALEERCDALGKDLGSLNEQLMELRFENQRLANNQRTEDPEISLEEVLMKCKELMGEKEKLEAEMQYFKDASIATILEKDREIEELQKTSSPEMLEALLKERDELYSENQELKSRMLTMESELESEKAEKEEHRRALEKESEAAEKFREQLDRNKHQENGLIEELRKSDEKIQQLEKREKTLEGLANERLAEIDRLRKALVAQEGQSVGGDELEKLSMKYDKLMEETRKEATGREEALRKRVSALETENSEILRKQEQLEKEKGKLSETTTALKMRIEALEQEKERQKRELEERMNAKVEEVVMEKERVEHEMRELNEELEHHRQKNFNLMPSAANLGNLKDDLEVFNNYLGVNDEKVISMPVPSNNKLPSVSKLPAAEEGDSIKVLTEENLKLKEELDETRKELQKIKEEEISNWEKELAKEKELFKSFRIEKENSSNEKVAELEKKLKETEEKVKVLTSEISELKMKHTQKVQSLTQSHEKELQSLQDLLKSAKGQTERLEVLEREKGKLESEIKRLNEDFEKERKFMENEVKLVEDMAVNAKMQYAEISMERDRFQFKYQKAIKEAKKLGVELKV